MKNAILFSMLILTTSCASYVEHVTGKDNEFPNGFSVAQVGPDIWEAGGKVKIKYETYDELKADREARIKNEMLSEKEAKNLLEIIPPGGLVYIYIFRNTIAIANTDNFTYVVQKNGSEIYRENGKRSVPSMPSRYGFDGNWWTNLDIIPLPSFDKNDEIKVFVIDKSNTKRDEFTLKYKQESVATNR